MPKLTEKKIPSQPITCYERKDYSLWHTSHLLLPHGVLSSHWSKAPLELQHFHF